MASNAKSSRGRKRPRDDSPQVLEKTLSSQDAVMIAIKFEIFLHIYCHYHCQESLPTLIDMFPERSFKFLKERLSDWKGSLPDLIDSILNSPEDSDDDDSGVSMNETSADLNVNASIDSTYLDNTAGSVELLIPEPGPSSSSEAPVNYIEKNFATLSSLFPEVSLIYLQENAWKIGNNPGKLEEFISRAFEDKASLPLKKDEKKVENKQLQIEKVKKLTARDFVAEFEDPHAHYRDISRKTSVLYKEHVNFYLKKHFSVHHSKFKKIVEENKNLFYPCVKALEAVDKGKGKGKGKKTDCATNLQRPHEMDLEFLKEYIYYKLEDKIRGLQDFRSKRRATEIAKAKEEGGVFECLVCYDDECLLTEVVMCDAGCMFCPTCTRRGSEVQIGENRPSITCLLTCGAEIPLNSLQKHLSTKLYSKLTDRKQLAEIEAAGLENLVQCPGCNYAVIQDSQDKVITCGNPECGRQTCRQCGEESHIPLTCDEVEKDSEVKARTKVEDAMTEAMLRECPNAKCKKKYFKEEGCNKMTCTCGQSMCYLCRKPVGNDYKHFFGQGATPQPGLCPLWSNVSKLHTDEITNAANKAKEAVGNQLKHDPSKNIKKPKDYHQDPAAFENAVFEETDSEDDDFDDDEDDSLSEDEEDEDIPDEEDILFIDDDDDYDDDGHGDYRPMDW